jgi:hypothetical protein
MSKSPLNISLGGIAAGLIGKGSKGVKKRLKRIETKVDNISKNMPRADKTGIVGEENTVIGPGTNMPGAVANETPDILGEVNETGVVAGGSFDPTTELAADNMFGKPLEGSFDRDMGLPNDPLTEELV